MKIKLLFLVGLFSSYNLGAQSFSINTDGTAAHGSAMLDVKSTTKGMLIPRMSTAERNAIPAPANGLLVYDTVTRGFWYHNSIGWIDLVNSLDNYWRKFGNHIYNVNSTNVGIGAILPSAKLHVEGGDILFNAGLGPASASPGNVPTSNTGRRLFWYADKAAFRAGYVTTLFWDKDSIGNYSFAAGQDVIAKGQYAVAFGWNNNASGEAATSVGLYNVSSGGFGSFTAGFNNKALTNSSVAIGGSNTSSGETSVSMGYFNVASGGQSVAAGYSSQSAGQYSVAIGNSVVASGQSATSFGESNQSSGIRSFTGNNGNIASGQSSAAFGFFNVAKAKHGFTTGIYNDDGDNPNPNVENSSDRIFQIGNGFDNAGTPFRKNALTVLRNGNVGIGSINPLAPLEFEANGFGRKISLFRGGVNNECGFGMQPNLMQVYTHFFLSDIAFGTGTTDAFTENIRFTGTGNIGIGTNAPSQKLDIIGKIKITDGTQAAGRVLVSDATGVGTWTNNIAITPAVTGVFAGGGVSFGNGTPSGGSTAWYYANTYIDLPAGKWMVLANYLLSGSLPADAGVFIRTTFSDSNTGSGTCSPDVLSGCLISGTLLGPVDFGLATGQTIINNTTGVTKRYYMWANMAKYGTTPTAFNLNAIGSNFWSENQLTAMPMN